VGGIDEFVMAWAVFSAVFSSMFADQPREIRGLPSSHCGAIINAQHREAA
jgi:hypothetical protein